MRSLNADRILGGPEKLREHQSTYAAEMTDLGIRRGRPKRETKAEHKPAAIYRAEAAQDRAEAAKVLEAAHVIEADAKRRGKRSQRIERDSRAGADAFTKGLDAVEQGELVAAPRKSFGLDVQPVETPVAGDLAEADEQDRDVLASDFEAGSCEGRLAHGGTGSCI